MTISGFQKKYSLLAAFMMMIICLPQGIQAQTAASEPTPEQMTYAREVVLSSGAAKSFDAILPQFATELRQSFITRPELTKDLNEVIETLKPDLDAQREEMVIVAARIYARSLSATELKDAAAFFKSASGRKYVDSQPVILDQLFNEMQSWTGRMSDTLMVKVRAEMKKRGHTF